jgi:hypothetical protein
MADYRITSSSRISAPADVVYRLIADYRDGHPRIVPAKYFSNLLVESGGYGAGTLFAVDMTVLGRTQHMRALVSEPQPGRVLTERDLDRGIVTTFEVVPAGADACDMTITTDVPHKGGLAGTIERFLTRRLLPRIYREELSQLDAVARAERPQRPQGR